MGGRLQMTATAAMADTLASSTGSLHPHGVNCPGVVQRQGFRLRRRGDGGGGGGAVVGGDAAEVALSASLGKPGTVTSSPAGIDCGEFCAGSFTVGTVVKLQAVPLPVQSFTGWSGACSGQLTATCMFTMSKALSTKAGFIQ